MNEYRIKFILMSHDPGVDRTPVCEGVGFGDTALDAIENALGSGSVYIPFNESGFFLARNIASGISFKIEAGNIA